MVSKFKLVALTLLVCLITVGLLVPTLLRSEPVQARSKSCQLTWSEFGLAGESLSSVLAFSATNVWFAGFAGGGAIYHWDGVNWSAATLPTNGPTSYMLTSIEGSGPDNIWAVGYELPIGDPVLLHWDGSLWKFESGPETHTPSALYDVVVLSQDNAWAVGASEQEPGLNTRLVLHWDGTMWSRVEFSLPNAGNGGLRAVSARGPDDIWVGGDGIFRWDGSTWHPIYDGEIVDLYVAPKKQAWAITSYGFLRWDGNTWHKVIYSGFMPALTAIEGINSKDIYVSGSALPYSSYIFHWDGKQWNVAYEHLERSTGINDITLAQDGSGWAVGWAQSYDPLGTPHPSYGRVWRGGDPCFIPTPLPTAKPTRTPGPPPKPPVLQVPLDASLVFRPQVTLKWKQVKKADRYEVEIRSGPNGSGRNGGKTAALQWHVRWLTPGETYSWRVRSCSDSSSCGAWSPIWKFTYSE